MRTMANDYSVRISHDFFTKRIDSPDTAWVHQHSKSIKNLGIVLGIIENDNPRENILAPPPGAKLMRIDVTMSHRYVVYAAFYDDGRSKSSRGEDILLHYRKVTHPSWSFSLKHQSITPENH